MLFYMLLTNCIVLAAITQDNLEIYKADSTFINTKVVTNSGEIYYLENAKIITYWYKKEQDNKVIKDTFILISEINHQLIHLEDVKLINISSNRKTASNYWVRSSIVLKNSGSVSGEFSLMSIKGKDISNGLVINIAGNEIRTITFP